MAMPDTLAKLLVLLPTQTITATTTGTAVDTSLPYASPQSGVKGALAGRAIIGLTASAVTGTSPTFDVVVQGSWDRVNWVQLTVLNAAGTVTAWTQITASSATWSQERYLPGPLPPFLRALAVVGGTSPSASITMSVLASNQR